MLQRTEGGHAVDAFGHGFETVPRHIPMTRENGGCGFTCLTNGPGHDTAHAAQEGEGHNSSRFRRHSEPGSSCSSERSIRLRVDISSLQGPSRAFLGHLARNCSPLQIC